MNPSNSATVATPEAVLIPGGGLTVDGQLPAWSKARLDRALQYNLPNNPLAFIPLSAGTVHKPPPLNAAARPIFEAQVAARYLIRQGVDKSQIYPETSSYDTIGNAYFARVVHCEPRAFKRLAIVTSQFHYQRVKKVFSWVFGLPGQVKYSLSFVKSPNDGVEAESLTARVAREKQQNENVSQLARSIGSIEELHQWLFTKHDAYRADPRFLSDATSEIDSTLSNTY